MREHVLVPDKNRRILPDRSAGNMIPVVVAVEHIANGNIESRFDLGAKLYREISIGRVYQNNAFVGN